MKKIIVVLFAFIAIGSVHGQQLGTPTPLQQILNALPAIPIAGRSLKFEFGGTAWVAKLNGENLLAGTVETVDVSGGSILTLKQTHIWAGAAGRAAGGVLGGALGGVVGSLAATWVATPGPEIVLDYNNGTLSAASDARIAEARSTGGAPTTASSATAAGAASSGLRAAEAAIAAANAAMETRAAETRLAEALVAAEAKAAETREAERRATEARSANSSESNIRLADARAAEARAAEALAVAEARMAEARAIEAREAERRMTEASTAAEGRTAETLAEVRSPSAAAAETPAPREQAELTAGKLSFKGSLGAIFGFTSYAWTESYDNGNIKNYYVTYLNVIMPTWNLRLLFPFENKLRIGLGFEGAFTIGKIEVVSNDAYMTMYGTLAPYAIVGYNNAYLHIGYDFGFGGLYIAPSFTINKHLMLGVPMTLLGSNRNPSIGAIVSPVDNYDSWYGHYTFEGKLLYQIGVSIQYVF